MVPGSIQNSNRRKWMKLLQKNSLEAWAEEHLYSIRSINFNIRSGKKRKSKESLWIIKKKNCQLKTVLQQKSVPLAAILSNLKHFLFDRKEHHYLHYVFVKSEVNKHLPRNFNLLKEQLVMHFIPTGF